MKSLLNVEQNGSAAVSFPTPELRGLHEHCSALSLLFNDLGLSKEHYHSISTPGGEHLDWFNVSEWLNMAASIVKVEVDTARFDSTIFMCGSAADYYDKKSDVLGQLATELSTFNFIWGASESVIKVIDPKNVPKRKSIIDAACNFLKNEFEPDRTLLHYPDVVDELRLLLKANSYYGDLSDDFRLKPFVGVSGVGLNVVRKIRNRFAHGTLTFPEPTGWGGKNANDVEAIQTSSRIILLTIQMLLLALYRNERFTIEINDEAFQLDEEDDDGEPIQIDLGTYLRVLHLNYSLPSTAQLALPL
jgi:hypothetical protein